MARSFSAATDSVVPPNSPKKLQGATASYSSFGHSHVQSDVSSKASSMSVMGCKPIIKA